MSVTLLSAKNHLLKAIRRAASQGGLTADGFALAEGFHLWEEAQRSGVEIGAVILSESAQARQTGWAGAHIEIVADSVFSGLTTTEHPQGVLALVRLPQWTLEDCFQGSMPTVVLDGVQDPGNAGAILRSAEAFGASGVIFLKGSVNPYNPKCLRGSAGSLFRVPVVASVDAAAVEAATKNYGRGAKLYAAAPRATADLDRVDLASPCVIVVGAEARGVSPAIASRAELVRIPTRGVESLNAAVACAVILYEARRQRGSQR